MMTLPPAHILGAALAQSVGGALLTILVICAPLLGLWALCHWLERALPPTTGPSTCPSADADPIVGPMMAPVSTPSGRIILHPPVGRRQAAPALMSSLTLTDLDLAAVTTLPVLPSIHPATPAGPVTPPAIPPVSSSLGSSLGVLDRERREQDGCAASFGTQDDPDTRDARKWPPRPPRPHGYILAPDGQLVRLATLRLETAYPLERRHWN